MFYGNYLITISTLRSGLLCDLETEIAPLFWMLKNCRMALV